jgi:Fe-S oxidoreductase
MSESPPAGKTAFDRQGSAPDAQRLQNAITAFASDFGAKAAIYMESCVRCGLCAEACHFFVTTGDPKYTPINKIQPFERAYARGSGPLAPLYRRLHIGSDPTIEDLETWEELIYDSCTLCGRCTLACPMGIDIAELVKEARHGMYAAGLVPDRLAQIARNTEARHSPFGEPEDFLRAARRIADEFEVEVNIDRPRADILVTTAPGDLEDHPKSFAGAARILNRLGLSWTYASDAFEATNFGFLSGNMELQKALTCRLIDKAVEIGAHTVLLPECGHAYGAARWEAAQWYGRPVPVRVIHMVEFLAEQIERGAIAVRKVGDSATFHDPCQIVRRGGLELAPRVILRALGFELRELADHGVYSYCCGGGGGVIANARAKPLRYKVFEMKQRQVEATGATHFVTSCGQCRLTFSMGAQHFNWDKPVESLLELVADNMVGDRKIA